MKIELPHNIICWRLPLKSNNQGFISMKAIIIIAIIILLIAIVVFLGLREPKCREENIVQLDGFFYGFQRNYTKSSIFWDVRIGNSTYRFSNSNFDSAYLKSLTGFDVELTVCRNCQIPECHYSFIGGYIKEKE